MPTGQTTRIQDPTSRYQTIDAVRNPHTCVASRSGVTDPTKDSMIAALVAAGLAVASDANAINGGLDAIVAEITKIKSKLN